MNGEVKAVTQSNGVCREVAKKLPPLNTNRKVSWTEKDDENDIEIAGTPQTPRTSTTPGRSQQIQNNNNQ